MNESKEVRRPEDGELCGYVVQSRDGWRSTTVFGGELGLHAGQDEATRDVIDRGLSSLADRWTLVDIVTGEEQLVCIQEASPAAVTVALGFYSLPGVPSLTLTRQDLLQGQWRLQRQ